MPVTGQGFVVQALALDASRMIVSPLSNPLHVLQDKMKGDTKSVKAGFYVFDGQLHEFLVLCLLLVLSFTFSQ
jgi:hypothetical protein